MHDFSGVQEGANGYCVLLRGSAAAAGAVLRQHAPYVVFFTLVFARSKPWQTAAQAQARRPQRR